MIVIGIDPGKTGAVSLFVCGALATITDLPMIDVLVSGKPRPMQNPHALVHLLLGWTEHKQQASHVFVEKVQAMPRDGAVGAFSFGVGFGQIIGILAALEIPYTLVPPAAWKKAMRLSTDKGLSRAEASRLFPAHAKLFIRKKDEGRAEAALLGLYGTKHHLGRGES